MKKINVLLPVFIFLVIGCAANSEKVAAPTSNRPAWVDRGGGAFPGDARGQIAFYGVGVADAKRLPTVSSRRNMADQQARVDLAQSFQSQITSLVKAYERVVSDNESVNIESFNQMASTAFTDINLSGAFIVDRYFDPKEQAQYSLVRMSLSDFQQKIEQLEALSDEVQQTIINNAESAFEEMLKQN